MTEALRVLIVDDDWTPSLDGVETEVVHPVDEDFTTKLEHVGDYQVLLIDQNLELPMEISLSATDGASLVGHFRSWSRSREIGLPPLVITTSDGEAFKSESPVVGPPTPIAGSFVGREHRLAPSLDVEWLLQKSDPLLSEKVESIAEAWSGLLSVQGDPDRLFALLGFRAASQGDIPAWQPLARRAVTEATLPFQRKDVNAWVAAQSTVRWLLHRALPFPGILVSDVHAAWALNVTRDSLEKYAASDTKDALAACIYRGALADLFSRRWWLSGLDLLGWNLDQQMGAEGAERSARQDYLDRLLPKAGLLDSRVPTSVVSWSADLVEGDVINVDDAVQLRPPGWPSEAIAPWAAKSEVVNDPVLRSMVIGSEGEYA